ncbi:Beta-1,4-galactosyltransferase [uncultured Gammaproteobacteria bacterium]|jgi:glycosyl transferase family 25|uniref:glycosyltransferase family 25 protein n=1 Tax=thiotrophic endosymbiont of Bathymodiolus puteoserpentis (Logatchev) TaxID=343240 RepID=UPI0010B75E0D|nr:glycosyltransferase family 25 protein [thiotrophic endosymbiont of Bathymodiolus puteoserpentis (Logatchev)]CAC9639683.1 Beta-1,4-galactosyltransferase [uncultured Gammaproteobacteria bacterium]CAC9641386.1 Beta-1,4-galactosyltransferase [uncultured Gammaproteobacteria bacterium]CAC9645758.1 Beta-1,4-galactosyltransferase [uncultured Gammaproteobacteria bacterium]CAC9647729.1 Beta-1,4-galactosyltransferase [uncultured Gammaproteobacteria bacterium]CAC9649542.1 Beta-1,4-galactosyltransferase
MNILIISLSSAIERRNFQQMQMEKLKLDFEFLDATSINDIDAITYKKHAKDWQRPLKNTEVACYYSHHHAWEKIIQNNKPALILEDDALLSNCVPSLLKNLLNKKNIDLINFENRGRKKFVAKKSESIGCNSKLIRLYQDRTGAAGYILYPNGAKKLIQCEQQKGIALADAHITACHSVKAYQVEPTPIIQLDYREHYNLENTIYKNASESILGTEDKSQGSWIFRIKRIVFQLKLGLRQVVLITKSERRYIEIRKQDF